MRFFSARHCSADLFISLHANASTNPDPEGAAVSYLSIDEYGEEARELAVREGQAIPVPPSTQIRVGFCMPTDGAVRTK